MTNRLEQLAIDAGLIAGETNGFDRTALSPAEQRFAELIMAECAYACTDEHCNTLCSPTELIDGHFGL